MNIHKSHSKKELCNIITTCNLNINNPRQYKKKDLVSALIKELHKIDEISPELTTYFFANKIDLIYFLMNCNPKKLLTVKEKNEIIKSCKRISHYINNSYNVSTSTFKTINDVYEEAERIAEYGDIPSVRRVCKKLKNDPNKLKDIKPKLSPMVEKELEEKKLFKKVHMTNLKINREGPFIVSFD